MLGNIGTMMALAVGMLLLPGSVVHGELGAPLRGDQAAANILAAYESGQSDLVRPHLVTYVQLLGQDIRFGEADWMTYHALSICSVMEQRFDLALKFSQEAYEQSGRTSVAGHLYANLLAASQRHAEANVVFQRLATLSEPDLSFCMRWAQSAAVIQEYELARRLFARVYVEHRKVLADATAAHILMEMGRCSLYLGAHDEAVTMLQKSRELNPRDARSACVLGHTLVNMGKFAEARETLELARELDPNLFRVLYFLGLCHAEEGDMDMAGFAWRKCLRLYRQQLEGRGKNGEDYFFAGQAALRLGRTYDASLYFTEAEERSFRRAAPHSNSLIAYSGTP